MAEADTVWDLSPARLVGLLVASLGLTLALTILYSPLLARDIAQTMIYLSQ